MTVGQWMQLQHQTRSALLRLAHQLHWGCIDVDCLAEVALACSVLPASCLGGGRA